MKWTPEQLREARRHQAPVDGAKIREQFEAFRRATEEDKQKAFFSASMDIGKFLQRAKASVEHNGQ